MARFFGTWAFTNLFAYRLVCDSQVTHLNSSFELRCNSPYQIQVANIVMNINHTH
jgi:hypothetical protein